MIKYMENNQVSYNYSYIVKRADELEISAWQTKSNVKKLCKKLKKMGSKNPKVVAVQPFDVEDAKPNACLFNVYRLKNSNRKKYRRKFDVAFGYVVFGNVAYVHVWNVELATGQHLDCTPQFFNVTKRCVKYIDATDLLLEQYFLVGDLRDFSMLLFTKADIKLVSYYDTIRLQDHLEFGKPQDFHSNPIVVDRLA